MRRRVTKDETLEQKIVKAQEKVARTAAAHERAVDALQILLDKRDAIRRGELVKAIMKSNKTYEEVMAFLNTGKRNKR